jgi:NAD(P)-dependent dehydrogenase (short-subunit alcohol dehydrogenase family)
VTTKPLKATHKFAFNSFQVNHLAHFLLTIRLLPLIKYAAQNKVNGFTPRVVIVGSEAARVGKIDYSYLQDSDKLPFFFSRYADSKLMNAMFTKKLAEKIKDDGAVAHVLHPGFVASGIITSSIFHLMSQRFLTNVYH